MRWMTTSLVCLVLALGGAPSWAQAQASGSTGSASSASSASKKAGTSKAKSKTKTTAKTKTHHKAAPHEAEKESHGKHSKHHKKLSKTAPVAQAADAVDEKTPDEALGAKEMQIAQWVDQGSFPCDEGGGVTITADQNKPGYFVLANKGQHYRMSPRVSVSGAVRLESNAGSVVWLQLANKSMLIEPKLGSRIADGCMSDSQKRVAAELALHPEPSILDQSSPQPAVAALSAGGKAAATTATSTTTTATTAAGATTATAANSAAPTSATGDKK